MSAGTTDTIPQVTRGILQRIDLIDREVTVRQENGSVTYSVSSNCEVLLNGERVKLRMLQPRDRVRIAYRPRSEHLIALSVEALTRIGKSPVTAAHGPAFDH
jgi:hypothetical protein